MFKLRKPSIVDKDTNTAIEGLAALMCEVFKKICLKEIPKDMDGVREQYNFINGYYKDFDKTHLVIAMHMVTRHEFDKNVFKQYLYMMHECVANRKKEPIRMTEMDEKEKEKHSDKILEEMIHCQSTYAKNLYIVSSYSGKTRPVAAVANSIYRTTFDSMKKSYNDIKAAKKQGESVYKEELIEFDKERRNHIVKFLNENDKVAPKSEYEIVLQKILDFERENKIKAQAQDEKLKRASKSREITADPSWLVGVNLGKKKHK